MKFINLKLSKKLLMPKSSGNLTSFSFLVLAITAFTLSACRGEKYKDYDAQQKAADEKQALEASKIEESKSFDIAIVEDLLPEKDASGGHDYYTNMKGTEVKAHFDKFNELVESNPIEAAKYLTLATHPWAIKPIVTSISAGSKYLDKSLNLISQSLPGDLFKFNGNKFQNLALSLGINLVQGYALESSNFTTDANFKLLLTGFLFLKKAELEMQIYRSVSNSNNAKASYIDLARSRTKRYLELGLSLVKYTLNNDKTALEQLSYPVQFVDFDYPLKGSAMVFDIFAKESDISMENLILNDQTGNILLNGAFKDLGYLTAEQEDVASEAPNLSATDVDAYILDKQPVDVSKMNNQEVLSLAVKYLNHYKIKNPSVNASKVTTKVKTKVE